MIIVGYSRQFTPPPDASSSYTATAVNSAAQTTYTFSSQSIGTAAANRYVVVGITAYTLSSSTSISSVTIGGVSATQLAQAYSGGVNEDLSALYIAAVPTGTTADVVITFSTAPYRCGIGVYRVIDLLSSTPTNTYTASSTSNPLSVSADISAGGVAIAVAGMVNSGAAGTYTWAGLTERYDATVGFAATHSGASADFASAQTGLTISSTYSQTPTDNGALAVAALR